MIKHYISTHTSSQTMIDDLFVNMFSSLESYKKIQLPEEGLFDRTSEFQDPSQIKSKLTLTSSGSGILRMISHALSLQDSSFSVSYIGESAKSDPQITYFIDNSQKNILLFNKIAEQVHLSGTKSLLPLDFRLGAIRQDILPARSYVADSTYLFFNINALKWSDAPAQTGNNPSGLTTEQANQLAFLAGQSHKNKYFILYGFDNPDRDPHGISLNTAVQILWYYQYGATVKAQAWPIPEEHQQDFMIETSLASYNLLFRKDRLTNQWFHKIPFEVTPQQTQHQWIASSHEEYLASANEDLPPRLLAWYDVLE